MSGEYSFRNTIAAFGRPSVGGNVSFFDSINGGNPVSLGSVPINPHQSAVGFTRLPRHIVGNAILNMVAADFNNDGIPDLVTTDLDGGTYRIMLGNGDGIFTNQPVENIGYQPDVVKVRDFNSDGVEDVAITRRSNNLMLMAFLMASVSSPTPSP